VIPAAVRDMGVVVPRRDEDLDGFTGWDVLYRVTTASIVFD